MFNALISSVLSKQWQSNNMLYNNVLSDIMELSLIKNNQFGSKLLFCEELC